MNTKIYNELQRLFRTSPQILRDTNALQQAIAGTFGVGIQPDPQDNLYELVEQIDEAVLSNYFSNVWQPKTKQYKYSGLSMIDEINGMNPREVLDLGCGYNEFRGKINNLTGVDAYNNRADIQSHILQYWPGKKFDIVICLGSINFGTAEKIYSELEHAVELTTPGGLLYFRANPGEQHAAPESRWIDFFSWDTTFIFNSAQQLNCDVISYREDSGNRIYFVLKKKDK